MTHRPSGRVPAMSCQTSASRRALPSLATAVAAASASVAWTWAMATSEFLRASRSAGVMSSGPHSAIQFRADPARASASR